MYGSAGAIFHLQKMIQEQRDQLLGILKNVHPIDPVSPMDFPTFGAAGFLSNDDTLCYDPSAFPLDCDWTL